MPYDAAIRPASRAAARRRPRPALAAGIVALTLFGGLLLGTGSAVAAGSAYVALGDSYSSGLGTRDYLNDGTDCHRSPYAYPELAAARLGAALNFQACAGAYTADVRNKQLDPLGPATRYVTVSAGGNDAGFAAVLEQCAKPWPFTCDAQISAARAFIRDTLPGRLDALYRAIRARAPHATVVVVGYPRLFNGRSCNPLARFSAAEESDLNATADLLATATGASAAANGFAFADARAAFTGHAVCDAAEWINGLSNPISESYHPNRAGQAGYAGIVEPALTNDPPPVALA